MVETSKKEPFALRLETERASNKAMRVFVADDDENIRSALGLLLEQEPGLSVAGTAVNVQGLFNILGPNSPVREGGREDGPDEKGSTPKVSEILFLDWELPGWEPKQHMHLIRKDCPGLFIIALSVGPNECQVAMMAGADAYVCKSDPPDTVMRTVRDLARQYERE